MTFADQRLQEKKFNAFSRAKRIAAERKLYHLIAEIETQIDDCYGDIYNTPMSDQLKHFLKEI